ncbi:hypothetical protein LPJ79_003624 [Coemansia sp. RSA 1821]|nr:hypothetical protein LPJ68_002949 [Coemansia sp. RSA 1086]KAJ1749586.1 hypothetical protein LPJ79_003624 [Coemansia sp. RSA 1821]KAJ2668748.1 hypothetical protein IWW42_005017 [Coemansia sp. RSA 1085]
MANKEKAQGKQPASEKFSIFHFPPELLTNLHLHSKLNRVSKSTGQDKGKQSEGKAHISTPHSRDQETKLSEAFASARLAKPTCHTCGGIEFGSAQQQRAHFKAPWHQQNVQRKMEWRRAHTDASDESGYPWRPVKEEFHSDSEESLAEEAPVEQPLQSDSEDEEDEGGGQYLWFADSEHEGSIQAYGVHRRILLPKRMHGAHVDAAQVSCELQKMQLPPAPAKTHAELKADKKQRKAELSTQSLPQVDPDSSLWTLMASNGGFFAAAVFDNRTGTVIAHKAIQRYTTRRKQGGLQSKQDGASGRAAISAGAQIRRYNERRLQEEIYELTTHWQPLLARSTRVFVRVPRTSRRTFFKPDSALSWGNENVRTLPVSMGRPSLRELQRVYMTLTHIRVVEFDLSTNATADAIEPVSIQEPELSSMSDNTLEPEPRPDLIEFVYAVAQMLMDQQQTDERIISHLSEHLDKLLDAFSDPAMKLRYLEDCPHVQGHRTPTLLHLASQLGRRSLIGFLLDVGEDPTIINGHAPLYAGGMTAFQVARDRATRDTFRIYRFEHEGEPDGIDWERARVPDPLSPQQQQENEDRVREKKRRERERRKQQSQKQKKNNQAKHTSKDEDEMLDQAIKENEKQAKQAKQSLRGQVAQMSPKEIQERMRKMAAATRYQAEVQVEKQLKPEEQRARDRELRFQAAERRRKQQQTLPQQQGTSSTEKCTHCGRSLHGLVPFEQFDWKCCSIECLHGQQMVFGIDL